MRPLKSLRLEAIVELLTTAFGELADSRAADQLTYPLHDTVMSGFALMFFHHPSLLQFQRAMLVRAGAHQVLPVDAEEVRNPTADSHPQDCELTAGKRLIVRLRREHPQMALVVIGDDLYSHVPFVEQLQQLRLHYVLVAKPASHPTLVAAVVAASEQEVSQQGQWAEGSGTQQHRYTYRIVRQVPLPMES